MADRPVVRTTRPAVAPSPAGVGSGGGTGPARPAVAQEKRPWLPATAVAAVGIFLSVLDQTIAPPAYSSIQKDFGVNNVDIEWVTTGYRLAQAAMIPLGLWAIRRFGMLRMYLVALVLYAVTSTLCGLTQDLDSLVAVRILEGVPGGLGYLVSFAILYVVLPPHKKMVGQAVVMAVVLSAPGFSPVVGGFLVEHVYWRLVFFATVPVAAVGVLGALTLLPPLPAGEPRRFDWGGYLSITTALLCPLVALAKGPDWGWTSYAVLGLFTVGLDALVLFIIIERQVAEPLLSLRMFASQPFVLGLVLVLIVISAVASVPAFLPTYLQQVQNLTPVGTGLALVPQAASLLVTIPLAIYLNSAIGVRWTMVCGLAVMGVASLSLVHMGDVDMPRDVLVVLLAVRSAGVGLALVPALGAPVAALPQSLASDGITFRTMFQRVGQELLVLSLQAHAQHRQKQILLDRAQLLDPANAPLLHAAQRVRPTALLPQWREQQSYDLAQAYTEVFQIFGLVFLFGIVLALIARWGEKLPTPRDVIECGS